MFILLIAYLCVTVITITVITDTVLQIQIYFWVLFPCMKLEKLSSSKFSKIFHSSDIIAGQKKVEGGGG